MDFLSENQPENQDEGLVLFDKPVYLENFQSQSDVIIQPVSPLETASTQATLLYSVQKMTRYTPFQDRLKFSGECVYAYRMEHL